MATRFYSSIATAKTISTVPLAETGEYSNKITLNNTTGLPLAPFTLVVNPDTVYEEIITCTSLASGTTFNVSRAEESTTIQEHATGTPVRHMITARDLTATQTHYDATTAHGTTSAVVGISDLQILTNKTYKIGENVALTATSTELNVLDGITASTAELNYTDGVTSAIQTQLNVNTPVGSIVMWAKSDIPTGWLECNGQSTSSYPTLAGVVGATVPDMQGLVPVGFKTSDDAFGTLKGTGGSKTSTAAHTHNLASHSHTINHDHGAFTSGDDSPDHSHTAVFYDTATNQGDSTGGQFDTGSDQPTAERYIPTTGASVRHQHNIDVPNFTGSSGGPSDNTSGASSAAATNGNLQPYFTLKFIIKY